MVGCNYSIMSYQCFLTRCAPLKQLWNVFFPCIFVTEPSKWDSQPFLASKSESLEEYSHGGKVPGNEN